MKLVVDVGNSRIKWAWVDGRVLAERGVVERREPIEAMLNSAWTRGQAPSAALVSSVAGADFQVRLEQWVAGHWGCPLQWFRSESQTLGVVNGYADCTQLGSDRWAAVLGARPLDPGAVGVIDCGTAVTLDVVDAGNRHLGGLISPGLALAQSSLMASTANIREAAAGSRGLLGRSTAECVANGTTLGVAGAVGRWMSEVEGNFGAVAWIATGGGWPILQDMMGRAIEYDPDLVLRGLVRVLNEAMIQ